MVPMMNSVSEARARIVPLILAVRSNMSATAARLGVSRLNDNKTGSFPADKYHR